MYFTRVEQQYFNITQKHLANNKKIHLLEFVHFIRNGRSPVM